VIAFVIAFDTPAQCGIHLPEKSRRFFYCCRARNRTLFLLFMRQSRYLYRPPAMLLGYLSRIPRATKKLQRPLLSLFIVKDLFIVTQNPRKGIKCLVYIFILCVWYFAFPTVITFWIGLPVARTIVRIYKPCKIGIVFV
jgi:hypothetical protein